MKSDEFEIQSRTHALENSSKAPTNIPLEIKYVINFYRKTITYAYTLFPVREIILEILTENFAFYGSKRNIYWLVTKTTTKISYKYCDKISLLSIVEHEYTQ